MNPCPVCRQPAGFHDRNIHQAHVVPPHLTWRPDEDPPWARKRFNPYDREHWHQALEISVEDEATFVASGLTDVLPLHIDQDAAAVLQALSDEDSEARQGGAG